jgi:GTP-binding protein
MSAPDEPGLLKTPMPEVAIIGRSNVGKSSLLGMLLGAPSIVRTSRTPGRTQLLNLFTYGEDFTFVDLPGYGFAKLSIAERNRMARMTQRYLRDREALRGVLFLLDARREEVSQADRDVASFIIANKRPILIVATKSDLVPKNRQLGRQRALEKSFGVPAGWSVMCSTKTRQGEGELWRRIQEL